MKEDQPEREKLSFVALLPNLVTILGLCAGMTSISFALGGDYRSAAALIIFAALIDGLDGLLARRLKATSEIGAELDSLSDFLNFGVAPGLLVYHALLGDTRGIGWILVLVYTICCCIRLARFNVMKALETSGAEQPKRHFVGVPAPAGAFLALLPMLLLIEGIVDPSATPLLTGLWLGLVGGLMVSTLPTISPKSILVPRDKIIWLLIATAIIVGGLLTRLWLSLILIDVAYILLLGRSAFIAVRQSRA